MIQKVSIVMCTYNGAKYVQEQIESIVNQTYPIYEFIIQDDCSKDNTVEILNKYKSKYPYIHVFINEKQKGINNNFFSAIKRTTGDYIAISDQDDIWKLDKIEKQIKQIKNNLLCGCFSKPFSTDPPKTLHYDDRKPNLSILRLIFDASLLPGHTLFFHRNMLKQTFEENSRLLYDMQIALFASGINSITFCEIPLVNYRMHNSSATYTEPLNYKKSLLNGINLIIKSFNLRKSCKYNVSIYYGEIYEHLSKINSSSIELSDSLKLCNLISKQSLTSIFKASLLCYKNRSKIFRVEGEHGFLIAIRSFFQPILIYQAFDNKRKSNRIIE